MKRQEIGTLVLLPRKYDTPDEKSDVMIKGKAFRVLAVTADRTRLTPGSRFALLSTLKYEQILPNNIKVDRQGEIFVIEKRYKDFVFYRKEFAASVNNCYAIIATKKELTEVQIKNIECGITKHMSFITIDEDLVLK